jgi:hypothetical protein
VTGGDGVGWRLLGSNNRELGRSAVSYADAEAALRAIARIRELAVEGEAHILHHRGTTLWAWHLEEDGILVANSGRGFRYERECRHNLDQFRAEAPGAPAADTQVPSSFPWQRAVPDSVEQPATP